MTEEIEKEAESKAIETCPSKLDMPTYAQGFANGAKFGYNKAKEDADKMKSRFLELCNLKDMRIAELEKANKWHYPSKGEYPKDENKICLLYLGNMFNPITGWYKNGHWSFEDDRNDYIWQDTVIAWKEIILPKESG